MTPRFLLSWYLTLQFFSLAGLPLAFSWLRGLPSRGYAAAKALGLLLSGVLLWWGGTLHLWDTQGAAVFGAAGLLFLAGLWSMRAQWDEARAWWRAHRTFVLTAELLFAGAFLLWSAVRATQPQLETAGGEKWMEIAFLNAVLRSPTMPPHDPWLSGFAISYYYLGYLLLGMVTRAAAVPATVAFNLGNAAWFALAAVGAYGIVYDMAGGKHPRASLLAPLLLLVTGNGEGFLEVLHARGILPAAFWRWLDIRSLNQAPGEPFSWVPTRFFWWWQASRTIHDYTPWSADQEVIDEFPAFSFTLGDMHPHLLALPFVLLAVALALNLWKTQARPDTAGAKTTTLTLKQWEKRLQPWFGCAVILGALGFLNTWDFPIYWGLIVAAFILGKAAHMPQGSATEPDEESEGTHLPTLILALREALPEAVILGVLSIALYFPFWVGLRSQAGGLLPNLFNATRLPQFVVMFVPFVVPIVAIVLESAQQAEIHWKEILSWSLPIIGIGLLGSLILGILVGSPYIVTLLRGEPIEGLNLDVQTIMQALIRRALNPWTGLLLIAGCVTLVLAFFHSTDKETSLSPELTFPMLLVLLGLGLTLVPEFVFLKDVFSTRMNTIFKFYFQAWVLWSLASAWWLVTHTGEKKIATAATYLLVGVGLVYTLLAVPARAREHGTTIALPPDLSAWTLDGTAWLETSHPDDWAAVQWINQTIPGRPVILEAPGDNHKAYTYEGRVSALTGLPTVLGWAGHEMQWRGTYDEQARREKDLETLFTTTDPDMTQTLLRRYDITYIYIGPKERERYPVEGLSKFATLFPIVYQNDGVTIYQVQDTSN